MTVQVSVICIAYNHAPFINEALKSVFEQTYDLVEVIVLDDASTDGSEDEIKKAIKGRPVLFIANEENLGYTRTFNKGLALATGKYIVDFALDDVMRPEFVSESVARLDSLGEEYGVCFSNADYIDRESRIIGNHNKTLRNKGLIDKVPDGDVFDMILRRYFICTPTMMIRKSVFDRIGPYDENLAYEDFDFWVRSSRYFLYTYIDRVLMQKRKINTSMSAGRYLHEQNQQLVSVLKVCQKAFTLCKTKRELKSLLVRLYYEHRQCIRYQAFYLCPEYLRLINQAGGSTIKARLMSLLIRLGMDRHRVANH